MKFLDKKDYEKIKNLVCMTLFSRYYQRRIYAARQLNMCFKTKVKVEKIENNAIVCTYIKFGDVQKYILVGRYNKALLEEVPDDEERLLWEFYIY